MSGLANETVAMGEIHRDLGRNVKYLKPFCSLGNQSKAIADIRQINSNRDHFQVVLCNVDKRFEVRIIIFRLFDELTAAESANKVN